jgi:hypothetical protein
MHCDGVAWWMFLKWILRPALVVNDFPHSMQENEEDLAMSVLLALSFCGNESLVVPTG